MNIDDIEVFLPKFLSPESQKELFEGLKDFPENIDSRFYTSSLVDSKLIYQGDGIIDMLTVNLPDPTIRPAPSIIISNTCDIDLNNPRNFPSHLIYSPIINLSKYHNALLKKTNKSIQQINAHIADIRKQYITQVFYLPKISGKLEESIVFLDKICNFPNKSFNRTNLNEKRLFTLSNYGAYLFLLKLSIHFTRMNDNIDRRAI